MSNVRRVIVGARGSPGSIQARRYAQHLARDAGATLVPVLTWLPPGGDLADRRTPCEELRQIWARDARQKLRDALNLAWGTPPADPPVRPFGPARPAQLPPFLIGRMEAGDWLGPGTTTHGRQRASAHHS